MPVFLLMNMIVGFSSLLFTKRVIKIDSFSEFLISWFVLYFSQIVIIELSLGIFGILNLNNIILFSLAGLLSAWLFTRKMNPSIPLAGFNQTAKEALINKKIFFIILIILCFGSIKIFINLLNPPFGWDSLNYHFTFPVEWMKHGNLNTPITIFDDPGPSYYPINGSLFYLWLMQPLKNVFLADIGQTPFFVLAFLAVYAIAKKLLSNRENSFYAASLFVLIPNFFKQLQIAYVDIMVASLFLVCLNWLFRLKESFSSKNVLIFSLSAGLLLGTKTTALPYTILLILPFLFMYLSNAKKYHLLPIFFLIIICFGTFSYVRNFFETGNPLYPLDFKLFGRTIFNGVMDIYTYRAHFKIDDYRLSKILFHEGLGAQSLVFILPSMLLAVPCAIAKSRKKLDFTTIYFCLLPILLYSVYRFVIPLANVRYLYPLLGIGIVLGFYIMETLKIPKAFVNALVILCAFSSMFQLAKRQELIASTILTIILFIFIPFLIKRVRFMKRIKMPFIVILPAACLVFALLVFNHWYGINEYPRYAKMVKYSGFWPDAARAWDWLNTNTTGNNIAYSGRPVPFPLYGTNFRNNVFYVSVNKTDPVKLHFFPGSYYKWDYDFLSLHKNLEKEGNYRSNADYAIWLNNLLKRDTDFLFIYSLHQTKDIIFPLEDRWAKANSDKFALVFSNDTIHIYKVIK